MTMVVTEPTFAARQMLDISLVFDAAGENLEMRQAVQSAQFVPSFGTVTARGGTPTSVWTGTTGGSWVLNLKFMQDLEKTGSLVNYLAANVGKIKTVDLIPLKGSKISASVVIVSPPLGGDMEAILDATVSLPVRGAPQQSGLLP